ncbi:MAG: type II toxin-antitoxin system RelE/ParE family toxin [Candidatus Obscuribacterales bacterium]|nr:type II toxin-antitoxin system RelE/ParE family toxin [Candidatus Obscuribacterales bacterium]
MAWQIEFADSVLKQLKKLDKHTAKGIIDYLEKKVGVLDDPTTAGKPLSGALATFWRYRVGDYRVICHLEKDLITVLVLRVSHRSTVYEDEKQIAAKAASEINDFQERKKEEIAQNL